MAEYINVEKPFLEKLRQLDWRIIDQGIGIPQEPQKSLRENFKQVVLPDEFKKAIKRINILTTQDSPSIKLELFKDKIIVLKNTPEIGQGRDVVELLEEYQGKEVSVSFNPTYLSDALKNINKDAVELELASSEKPGVIRVGREYIYVVLPMQTT
ncbi:MAG: hypothetical protein U9Q63_04070 [Patescibacteria group bacterium]|nr:hypothetical protein [Patescibacteria group bacterium]